MRLNMDNALNFSLCLSFLLQSIQVKVDSADNHDRTRKFVWQKSSHIAQVVSQKLASVAQAFLQQSTETHVA